MKKMLVATKVKTSSSGNIGEQEHIRQFLHNHVNRKFLKVLHCSHAKQRQANVQKSVVHMKSCFFFTN